MENLINKTTLIDIHTHKSINNSSDIWIQNKHTDYLNLAAEQGFFSLGIHPWYPPETFDTQFKDQFTTIARLGSVVAIGECGLDKMSRTPWDQQLSYFKWMITLAEAIQKPLIIHCVKAYDEVLALLKGVNVPVIFHGFNKNDILAKKIIDSGYFISIGKVAFNESKQQWIKDLPIDKIFIESDESPLELLEIYKKVSTLFKIDVEEFILHIQINYKKAFYYAR